MVLEAGIAASSLTWSRVQPRIAQFSRVCSYDRAGLAWSESASTPRSMSALIEELRTLLDRTGEPPPYVLVGHSFGGLIIRAFARAYPTEIAGLVFVDPLHPEEWCDPLPEQRQMLRGGIFLSKVGAGLARLGVVRVCLTLLRRLSGGASALQPAARQARHCAARTNGGRGAEAARRSVAGGSGTLVASEGVPRHVAAPRGDP